jgi:hypothetical protein
VITNGETQLMSPVVSEPRRDAPIYAPRCRRPWPSHQASRRSASCSVELWKDAGRGGVLRCSKDICKGGTLTTLLATSLDKPRSRKAKD